jgi:D-xylose transport system substrate-binding protein
MRSIANVLAALTWLLVTASQAVAADVRVGLSLPTQREERWVKDRTTMKEEAKAKGVDLRVQVTDNDAAKQVAQCENLISQGVKVLILAPHDASSASVIVDKAVKAGIKVISYDRLVTDSPHEYHYLSFDNVKVGELQGDYITRKVPRGNYVVLAGSPTDNNARLFRQGAMKYIKPLVEKGDIKIVMEQWVKDWQPVEAQKLCEQALTATGNRVDAVLAPNDGTAGGCIQALAAQGLAGKVPITGQDAEVTAAIRIVQGTQSMTVFKDTRELGRKAIEMAVALANGQPIDTQGRVVNNNKRDIPSVLLTPRIVTKENLDGLLVGSGYLKAKQVYRKGSAPGGGSMLR